MNDIFFTSDLHLDHDNVRYHCDRPFQSVEEMNSKLIDNWNNIVTSKDTVIIGGDFAWKRHGRFINMLKGKKILVLGNHDKMSQEILNQFSEVHELLFKVFGKIQIMICHYPMKSWRNSCHGSWHLYGHCHGRMTEFESINSFDIGVDVWNYTPIPFEVICEKMNTVKTAPQNFLHGEAELNVQKNRETNLSILEKFIGKISK